MRLQARGKCLTSPNHPRFGTLFAVEVLPTPVERHFITESSEKSPDDGTSSS